MPELTDEHIEDLFADLRAGEIQQVRPPGVAAARATVRRRRTVTSVAAGVAVLAVAGGIAAVSVRATGHTDGSTDTTVTRQEYSDVVLNVRRDLAATAVDVHADSQGIAAQETLRGGSYYSVYSALRGTYTLHVACAGDGMVDIVVRAGTAGTDGVFDSQAAVTLQKASVPCARTATPQDVTFTVPTTGLLAVDATPDAAAKGRSAFAYRAELSLADRKQYQQVAASALPTPADETRESSMAAFLDNATGAVLARGTVAPGTFSLSVTCTGYGTVTFTAKAVREGSDEVDDGTVVAQRRIPCTATPQHRSLIFTLPGGRALDIQMSPNADATGRSAGAYQLAKA